MQITLDRYTLPYPRVHTPPKYCRVYIRTKSRAAGPVVGDDVGTARMELKELKLHDMQRSFL